MQQLGVHLRKMRKKAGLSQEDMAHALHMSISNISRFETDKYEIKGIDLLRWCKITNDPDMLMILYASIDVTTSLIASGASALITGFITTLEQR